MILLCIFPLGLLRFHCCNVSSLYLMFDDLSLVHGPAYEEGPSSEKISVQYRYTCNGVFIYKLLRRGTYLLSYCWLQF